MSKSSSKPKRVKPQKPYPEYPLTPNGNGCWSKVIRGHTHYFGPWEDPDAALRRYLEVKDDLYAGRTPKPKSGELTVRDICNLYLEHCQWKLERGKISQRTYDDEDAYCLQVVRTIGNHVATAIGARDFEKLQKSYPTKWGPVREAHHVKATKRIFKWAYDNEHIDRPPRYGSFKPPSVAEIRHANSRRAFTPEEIRRVLGYFQGPKHVQLRPMVLLAINGGFSPGEVARLKDTDVAGEYIDTIRPKTKIRRLVPLWPETREAIDAWLQVRKKPHSHGYLFVTKQGNAWFSEGKSKSPITQAFARALRELGIPGSFNCLRHSFQTVCDDEGIARHITRAVMGHVNPEISTNYSHAKMLRPIRKAVDTVRAWLFPEGGSV